jgi:prepilin-type N-terminal cleavage/methylation domain-containing protein
MSRRGREDDHGFTLVEVLLVVVILGVITLPLGELVIQYFQHTTQAQARLNESHDAQIAAAYFAQDVDSVGTRDQSTQALNQSVWVGSATGAPYACGGVTAPVLMLAWDDFSGPGSTASTVEAVYATRTADGQNQLVRYYCSGSATVQSLSVLARDLDAATPPSVACSGNGSSGCADHPNVPTTIKLTMTSKDPFDNGDRFTVTLTGQRRQTS